MSKLIITSSEWDKQLPDLVQYIGQADTRPAMAEADMYKRVELESDYTAVYTSSIAMSPKDLQQSIGTNGPSIIDLSHSTPPVFRRLLVLFKNNHCLTLEIKDNKTYTIDLNIDGKPQYTVS